MRGGNFNATGTFSMATYNVKELGQHTKNRKKKHKALNMVATTVKEVDADIVALQEVPSKKAFDIFSKSALAKSHYNYSQFLPTNDSGGHHMAVLSRYPIKSIESHRDHTINIEGEKTPRRFTRDVASVEIDVGGYPLRLYNVHFKATKGKNPQRSINRRKAEIDEAIKILTEDMKKFPRTLYVVAGDMNITTGDKELDALENNPGAPLIDPMEGQTGPEAYTFPARESRLDYILVSPMLASAVVPGSAHVHHSKNASKSSDHLPVKVTFEINRNEAQPQDL